MKLLEYPFDSAQILKSKRSIKRELLKEETKRQKKKIAVLGGSTTNEIIDILELFLLNYGIEPSFYASEFGKYWEDVMFDEPELVAFEPDLIYIHTSTRNLTQYPTMKDTADTIEEMLSSEYGRFEMMWEKIAQKYHCSIIQNNFEMPYYRLLGNQDVYNIHGKTHFVNCLNQKFYTYASTHENFYINDINYLSANYGLEEWGNPLFWHMYKYCLCLPAIPAFSFNLANIIKSLYGMNKKAFALDLDNTLWGGVVGDDGVEKIEIGHETSMGQVYSEFQEYIKAHKDLGVVLNVNSKNDYENAIAGLNHPEGTIKPEDCIVIKSNWNSKDVNIFEIANELNILPDSLVFVDDNPIERGIVQTSFPAVSAPPLDKVENYIRLIDRSGFFELTSFSKDDVERNAMYKANAERTKAMQSFVNYEDYLRSLNMTAVIRDFEPLYAQRITQLTNKSNQFNLTTQRYTQAKIEQAMEDNDQICLYGKLTDKYGDNGVITVVMGTVKKAELHIGLWLMSCRVLKRNMEHAMLDALVEKAQERGVKTLYGYYYKTPKNNMVKDFYAQFGFEKTEQNENGDSIWCLDIQDYANKNTIIKVEK